MASIARSRLSSRDYWAKWIRTSCQEAGLGIAWGMSQRLYQCADTLWPRSMDDDHVIKLPAGSTFFYDEEQTSDVLAITINTREFSIERSAFLAAKCARKNP